MIKNRQSYFRNSNRGLNQLLRLYERNYQKLVKFFPINRSQTEIDYLIPEGKKNSEIKIACKKLSNDNCIGIFIDGTRQKNGRVNKPKQGAALLAFKNQKLLLPVAIVNSHRLIRFKFFINNI